MRTACLVAILSAAGCSGSSREASDLSVERAHLLDCLQAGHELLDARLSELRPAGAADLPDPPLVSQLRALQARLEAVEATLDAKFGNKSPRVSDYSPARATRYAELKAATAGAREAAVRAYAADCARQAAAYKSGQMYRRDLEDAVNDELRKQWDILNGAFEKNSRDVMSVTP